ncbi:hypothetical protein [Paenibacillus crassostreae]|uniref:GAF domain-containing protein n=1 Tax=Paenibacillus crassostreae TaxID=1763538 RepID=A0A167DKC8_9BACL|nr:hypothetical protein [Paenibacillus crassostreae]AOZ91352.1 hypothetical protein LPB68_03450 [Paenibacillus crassostreae]OAB74489.1 hypothetical protein PNBC_10510 [Paenibacillus crassostreae]
MINSTTIQQKIQRELEELKQEIGLDFVAIALTDGIYRDIYWRFALGAKSDQYKKISVRMGKGMAGKVLQGMTPHVVNVFPGDVQEEVLEYPIFIVESLHSGVGVSIKSTIQAQRLAYGVLLVGHRSRRIFLAQEIARVQDCASVLAQLYDEVTNSGDVEEFVGIPKSNEQLYKDTESAMNHKTGPIVQLLHEAQAAGITCELLDQRITRLSGERQEEIAAIISLLVQEYAISTEASQLIIGQDELGHTVIEYEGYLLHPASQELFQSVMPQLKSLKCDLEILIEKEKQSVRFSIPTRLLLDEINWSN